MADMPWQSDLPPIPVVVLVLEFQIHGARSLKDKRARLSGLRQRFGKSTSIAVCESDHQDSHSYSQWSFVATASDPVVVERTLQEIETWAAQSVDAELVSAKNYALN